MDSTQQNVATTHSGEPSSSTSTTSLETKVLRSSARVKAAKEKERERAEQTQPSSSSGPRRTREIATPKGKGKEVADEAPRTSKRCARHAVRTCPLLTQPPNVRTRRSTLPTSTPLTINEPAKDAKGKKRAVPDENSEEEPGAATSASAPVKRTRTNTTYSLRSRTDTNTTPTNMPKKTRSDSSKACCRVTADGLQIDFRKGEDRRKE